MSLIEILPCPKCGASPRKRYRMPYSWIECSRCNYTGLFVSDSYEEADSIPGAIQIWNEKVMKYTEDKCKKERAE